MKHIKHIRSFVKRARRLSPQKQQLFDMMWPKYGITSAEKIPAFSQSFLNLEIGFGNGEVLFDLAQKYPEQNFIGIEVYKPGITHLLSLLKNQPLNNLKIYYEDAGLILENHFPDQSIDNIFILFPDPWPKKRHHKRRLIQPKFIEVVQKKLKTHGKINITTDCEDYAKHISNTFKTNANFTSLDPSSQPEYSIATKFEKRSKKLGHNNFKLWFISIPNYVLQNNILM